MAAPTLVVLAAGMGSRYGGIKQIEPVGPAGEAIIDYSIFDAIRAGFDRVVFVIRREIEADVREVFDARLKGRVAVDYVFQDLHDLPGDRVAPAERSKPWGTAHAVLAARNAVTAPFAVINGDDFYGREAFASIGSYLGARNPAKPDYAMVGYRLDRTLSDNGTVSRGIVTRDDEGMLVSIEEHTRLARPAAAGGGDEVLSYADGEVVATTFPGSQPVSMNLFGFTPVAFAQFEREFARFLDERGGEPKAEFYIPLAVDRLRMAGDAAMRVLDADSEWFGVTYREDRPAVVARIAELVAAGVYPSPLWG